MLKLCLCVSQGIPLWDIPTQEGNVLYLCLEDTFCRIQDRLFRLTDTEKDVRTRTIGFWGMPKLLWSGSKRKIQRLLCEKMRYEHEPELGVVSRIADELGICVHKLCADEEPYAIFVQKDTFAKLIVVSEINCVELDELINTILEKGLENHDFYG